MVNPGVKNRNLSECIKLATAGCHFVVELGCGFGDRLAGVGAPRRLGVDAHAPYIVDAMKRHPGIAFMVADAREAVRMLGGVDAVLMVDFLEHLDRDLAAWLIGYCQAVVRRIVLWVPLGHHPQTTDAYGMGGDHWQTHRSTWEAEELEALGFDVKVWPTVPNRPGIEPRAAFCVWECPTHP